MIIGVDFDNTIVSYDSVFHRVALRRGLIDGSVPINKTAVRDHLRGAGCEDIWTELQGYVYGPGMVDAEIFPGVKEFFSACRREGIPVHIISHRTKHPYQGESHDLHAAAYGWLDSQEFFSSTGLALPRSAVSFELTRGAKLQRIAAAGCTHFVDDLPELFAEPAFPPGIQRILFDPGDIHGTSDGVTRAGSWGVVSEILIRGDADHADEVASIATALLPGGERLAEAPGIIAGGRNNRAYRISTSAGQCFLLKRYSRQPGDSRNRFESERLFYRFAETAGIDCIPVSRGWDASGQAGLLEFVAGRKPCAGEIGAAEVAQAARFFEDLNRARYLADAQALPDASEACFSLEEHLSSVDGRISRLADLSVGTPVDREAREFIEEQLTPAWSRLRDSTAAELQMTPWRLGRKENCISPSDFGFHNSLRRNDGNLVFFDFEYAGWDDPAKTVCDFFCQPAVPAPGEFFVDFSRQVAAALELPSSAFLTRCQALLPVYRIKWCCILLNEFLPSGQARRNFALGVGAAEAAKACQLDAARASLAEACSNN